MRRRLESDPAAREAIGIADQIHYERSERARIAQERKREARLGLPPDPRRLALAWLEGIRDVIAGGGFPCSLDATHAVASGAGLEGEDLPDRQRRNMRTPWLVVGRYEPRTPIGYRELADALSLVSVDLFLEEAIGPQRLSQIRIVYVDPNTRRGEGDSIVSKIGAWGFVVSDVVFELVGGGGADEDALAVRYKETHVPHFYVYFSEQSIQIDQNSAWQRFGLS